MHCLQICTTPTRNPYFSRFCLFYLVARGGRQTAADPLNGLAARTRAFKKNCQKSSLDFHAFLEQFWLLFELVLAQFCVTFGVEIRTDFRGVFLLIFLSISTSILAPFSLPKPLPEAPRRKKLDTRFWTTVQWKSSFLTLWRWPGAPKFASGTPSKT